MEITVGRAALRTCFFTAYGAIAGAGVGAVIFLADSPHHVLSLLLGLLLVVLFAGFGYELAKDSKRTNLQRLGLIPIAPFAFSAAVIGIVIFLLFMAFLLPFASVSSFVRERKCRRGMKAKGRLLSMEELRPKLAAGEGTLIEEQGNKGTYHIWWTEDDVLSKGSPASTIEEFIAIFEGKEHLFNSHCLKEYLDSNTGRAFLTTIHPRCAKSDGLAKMFPRMSVAKVLRPFGTA